jgi:anti-sigma regulatory factor (Ser/Thr protein kinase)
MASEAERVPADPHARQGPTTDGDDAGQDLANGDLIEFKHVTVQASASHLAGLRRELHSWLADVAMPERAQFALVIAANEAATNAIEHAYGPTEAGTVELTFWIETGVASIEISDHGHWRQQPEHDDNRRRGIPLMRAFAETVHIDHDQLGTRVLLQQTLALAA